MEPFGELCVARNECACIGMMTLTGYIPVMSYSTINDLIPGASVCQLPHAPSDRLHSSIIQIEDEPRPARYREIGYPEFSRFKGCDHELFIIRRFDTLDARIVLGLQDDTLCTRVQTP